MGTAGCKLPRWDFVQKAHNFKVQVGFHQPVMDEVLGSRPEWTSKHAKNTCLGTPGGPESRLENELEMKMTISPKIFLGATES